MLRPTVPEDASLLGGLGKGELSGALGAITGAHDLIPELIVAGGSPQVMEGVLDIGALDLPTGGSRGGGLAAGVKP